MMKKLLTILLSVVVLAFTTPTAAQIANEIAGTYKGTLEVTLVIPEAGESPFDPVDQDIIITATGDEEMKLEIKDFKFALMPGTTPVPIGDINISDVPIVEDGEDRTFTTTTIININDDLKDLDTTLNGSVNVDDQLNLDIYIEWIAMDIKVKFTNGVKQTSGLNPIQKNNFTVYPGIANSEIHISGMDENSQYAIYNITGSLIKTDILNAQKNINISNLSNGLYLIKIGNHTVKFIKK